MSTAEAMAMGQDDDRAVEVRELLGAARRSASREALPLIGEALSQQLLKSLLDGKVRFRNRKISDPRKAVALLRRSGLEYLLVEGFAKGRIQYGSVSRHLDRLSRLIREQKRTAEEVKLGILAFDEIAQRLALAGGAHGPFQYPLADRPRDSLISFARSLHR